MLNVARRRSGADGVAVAEGSSGAPKRTSSSEMRASPMSRSRCLGSFCRQRCNSTRTRSGVAAGSSVQSGSARSTVASVSVTDSPRNAIWPVSISYSTHPNAQMSARRSTGLPFACSGDMYAAVPSRTPACVAIRLIVGEVKMSIDAASPSIAFAKPKSRTFTASSLVTFTFAGFRSRCTIPRSCAYSSASVICFAIRSASSIGIGPDLIRSPSVGPSTNSITNA